MKCLRTDILAFLTLTALIMAACKSSRNSSEKLPVGIDLLGGKWKLVSSSDGNALAGSTITVFPSSTEGIIDTLRNNEYCVRPTDVIWKDITTTTSRNAFSIGSLSNSCVSSMVYKPAMIVLTTDDEIKLTGTNPAGTGMVQTWSRLK